MSWRGYVHAFVQKMHGIPVNIHLIVHMKYLISWINESTETIHRMIQASHVIKDVTFCFVAYRDDSPEDTTYATKSNSENLTDATYIIRFIETVDTTGGGDGPEVFSSQISIRKKIL
jgi:hypothetical protein